MIKFILVALLVFTVTPSFAHTQGCIVRPGETVFPIGTKEPVPIMVLHYKGILRTASFDVDFNQTLLQFRSLGEEAGDCNAEIIEPGKLHVMCTGIHRGALFLGSFTRVVGVYFRAIGNALSGKITITNLGDDVENCEPQFAQIRLVRTPGTLP